MSVIAKNINLPESCFACKWKYACDMAADNGWIDNKRDDKCPFEELIICRNCAFFEQDLWGVIAGKPVIVAHEVCTRRVEPEKAKPEGFCYLAEKRAV